MRFKVLLSAFLFSSSFFQACATDLERDVEPATRSQLLFAAADRVFAGFRQHPFYTEKSPNEQNALRRFQTGCFTHLVQKNDLLSAVLDADLTNKVTLKNSLLCANVSIRNVALKLSVDIASNYFSVQSLVTLYNRKENGGGAYDLWTTYKMPVPQKSYLLVQDIGLYKKTDKGLTQYDIYLGDEDSRIRVAKYMELRDFNLVIIISAESSLFLNQGVLSIKSEFIPSGVKKITIVDMKGMVKKITDDFFTSMAKKSEIEELDLATVPGIQAPDTQDSTQDYGSLKEVTYAGGVVHEFQPGSQDEKKSNL